MGANLVLVLPLDFSRGFIPNVHEGVTESNTGLLPVH